MHTVNNTKKLMSNIMNFKRKLWILVYQVWLVSSSTVWSKVIECWLVTSFPVPISLFSLAVFYSLPPASLGPFPISFCSLSLLLLFSCLPRLTFASSPLQLSLIFSPLSDFRSACPGLRLRQQQQYFLCKFIPVHEHVKRELLTAEMGIHEH